MEELRASIKLKEEENFNLRKPYLQEAMQNMGLTNESKITIDMKFFQNLRDNNKHTLWNILHNIYLMQTDGEIISLSQFQKQPCEEISVESFINQCLEALRRFHLEIFDYDNQILTTETNIQQLNEALNHLNQQNTIINDINEIRFSYIQDKAFLTEIFKYYRIKYKVEYDDKLLSIYGHTHEKNCTIPVTSETQNVNFVVLCKPRQQQQQQQQQQQLNENEEEFFRYDYINLPFIEILSAISPKQFSINNYMVCYLYLSYNNEQDDLYDQGSTFEMQFELFLNKEERKKVIEKLIEYLGDQLKINQAAVQTKLKHVDQVLEPFNETVCYIRGSGLQFKKKERGACECKIF